MYYRRDVLITSIIIRVAITSINILLTHSYKEYLVESSLCIHVITSIIDYCYKDYLPPLEVLIKLSVVINWFLLNDIKACHN